MAWNNKRHKWTLGPSRRLFLLFSDSLDYVALHLEDKHNIFTLLIDLKLICNRPIRYQKSLIECHVKTHVNLYLFQLIIFKILHGAVPRRLLSVKSAHPKLLSANATVTNGGKCQRPRILYSNSQKHTYKNNKWEKIEFTYNHERQWHLKLTVIA
jgi:hypothetical protein